MSIIKRFLLVIAVAIIAPMLAAASAPRVLYITGGGWHDYAGQVPVITNIIGQALAGAVITVSMVERVQDRHPAFDAENWSEGYDLVVYNKCNAPKFSDPELIERIVRPHREGLPAVLIHGTLHNYWPDAQQTGQWVAFCGAHSPSHERHAPVTVTVVDKEHPIMLGVPELWTYPRGELYRINKMSETATCLAKGVSGDKREHCIIWTNQFGEGRVFATTIGHATETMKTEEFSRLLTQGIRWAIGK
jgi:type 1 glutamine amidotransferase